MHCLALCLLSAAPLLAQDSAHVMVGDPSAPRELHAVDAALGVDLGEVPGWHRVTLEPLELAGRFDSDPLHPLRPALVTNTLGESHLRLAYGLGTVHAYSRRVADSLRFGFLRLDSQGGLQPLAERHEAPGGSNPYLSMVAPSPDGWSLLVATVPSVGGDLLEIELATGARTNRTLLLAPLSFGLHGLHLGALFGAAATDLGPVRFARLPGVQAELLILPGIASAYSTRGLVASPGGHYLSTVYGSGPGAAHHCVFGATGPVRVTNTAPAAIRPAGFAGSGLFGPTMAVDDLGTTAAYSATVGIAAELFMRDMLSTPSPVQLSANMHFLDTLDEIGVVWAAQPGEITFAIGDSSGIPGDQELDKAEIYRARIDATGAPQFTNVTGTSGVFAPPFLTEPQLKLERILRLADGTGWLALDGEAGRILSYPTAGTGFQVLVSDARELDLALPVAGGFVLGTRRDSGAKPRELRYFPGGLAAPGQLFYSDNLARTFMAPQLVGVHSTRIDLWQEDDFGNRGALRVDTTNLSVTPSGLGSSTSQIRQISHSRLGRMLLSEWLAPGQPLTWSTDLAASLVPINAGPSVALAGVAHDASFQAPRSLCQAPVNSTGHAARLTFQGQPSLAQLPNLAAHGLPPGELSAVLRGFPSAPTPFGAGSNCVGTVTLRSTLRQVLPEGTLFEDLSAGSLLSTGLTDSQAFAFQVWFRDAAPLGMSTSNALVLDFLP